jgi:hypothetical protein
LATNFSPLLRRLLHTLRLIFAPRSEND